jgi:hypothetical protein
LRRIVFQPLVDKAVSKLTVRNGNNINHAVRSTLVKAVLTTQAVYCLTSLRAPKATPKEIDNLRKSFLWARSEKLTMGTCKVNWPRSTRPTKFGGLSILHLGKFARALHLRWLWKECKGQRRPLTNSDTPCDMTDRLLFAAATSITVGDGRRTSFWSSAWLQGQRPQDLASKFQKIKTSRSTKLCTIEPGLGTQTYSMQVSLPNTLWSMSNFGTP